MSRIVRMLVLVGMTLGLLPASESFAQNAVADWQAVMETAIPNVALRKNAVGLPYWGYVTVAMYDAVNSIDRRYQPFAVKMHAPAGASEDAAAASAAHDVLLHYFPLQQPTLDAALLASLAKIPDGQSKSDGVSVGQAVAAQWIAMRTGDGLEAKLTFTWGSGPGVWEPVPSLPVSPAVPAPVGVWLRAYTPFVMTSADQFLAQVPPPPALSSTEWALNFNLTKTYGAQNSTVRTPYQTETGLFYTDEAASMFSRSLRRLIVSQNLNTADSARMAAMFYVATTDAITACMNAKYHYAFWRPIAAIRNADTDGNPATVADPNWVPLAATPGHPEYPAAHGTVTQAGMDALERFFGTDQMPYSLDSNVTKTTHSFTSFDDVVAEVDDARVFGGMHYRHSTREGNRLGRMVTFFIFIKNVRHAGDDNSGGNEQ